jgi:glycosyltransferase involved in cell wall biosynthesis
MVGTLFFKQGGSLNIHKGTPIPVTVMVQTKNEAVGILHCLESLREFDEVIVVDSNSTDDTESIATAWGAKVIRFTWNNAYPKKKQWQLDNVETRNPWILFLDADETPDQTLLTELRSLPAAGGAQDPVAFDIRLDYVFAGKLLRHGHRVVKRALVQRGKVAFPEMPDLRAPGMGELEGHYQPAATGLVGRLDGRILHDDQDPVRTWFDRHNRYSDWEAYLRTNSDAKDFVSRSRSRQGRLFDRVPFKPAFFFAYAYIARGGVLDGRPGFDYAIALATYYWQIGLKVREASRVVKK